MIKAEECLKREKGRVSHYLHSSTEEKFIEKVQEQLLSKVFQQLLEKEHSGCYALLREDKHVTSEGIPVVNQAEDAANSRKENRNVLGLQEQMFIRKVVALHEKYMLYVTTCFAGHTLFHKALKEAFEVFCNKVIAGSSSSELLSNFSDNILKKGDSEKLDDDVIEDTLDKKADREFTVKLVSLLQDEMHKDLDGRMKNKAKLIKSRLVGIKEQFGPDGVVQQGMELFQMTLEMPLMPQSME